MERTVKHVAARVELPERTIRYYDRIGLVSPQDRTSAGYRLYGAEDEGKLRFVRQAKDLGLSLEDIRALIDAAERGCCGEVVPELDRLLDRKIAEINTQVIALAEFRSRLVAFRAGHGSRCGCHEQGAFCGCLHDAPPSEQPPTITERTPDMANTNELELAGSCGCSANGGGCGCGCDGGCGCGAASQARSVEDRVTELEQAKREIDRQLAELQRA